MGACCSSNGTSTKTGANSMHVKPAPLQRQASHTGALNKLALQFPVIQNSFTKVKLLFTDSGDVKEVITADRLGARLKGVGGKTFSGDEVRALFNLADLDGSKTISFREFLIAIAHGFYLKEESDDAHFQEIARGFKIVQKAFQDMDDDHSGTVDAIELKRALFAGASKRDQSVLEARFRELDFNGDGSVSFSEFLYGFAQWVGFGDNDDDNDNDIGISAISNATTATSGGSERKDDTNDDTRSRASPEGDVADIIVRKDDRPLISSLKKRDSPKKHARRVSNHKPTLAAPTSAVNAPLTSLLPTLPGMSTTSSGHAVAPLVGDVHSAASSSSNGDAKSGRLDRTPSVGNRKKGRKHSHGNGHTIGGNGADKTSIQTISIVPG